MLVEVLLRQPIVQGSRDIAERIAAACGLMSLSAGETFIHQDGTDNDIFLILHGDVDIQVNGRGVAVRSAGQHVGEMALIDIASRRSATASTKSATVLAKVSEADFSKIADEHPTIWRRLAVEIAARLGQRGASLKAPNLSPHIFIGSSVESLPYAEAIQSGLAREKCSIEIWTQNIFKASAGTIEALEQKATDSDFAILLLRPDDLTIIRGEEHNVPRDNVIFELGLFMGALGRERTYMVVPHDMPVKLPTDLIGITPLTFEAGNKNLAAAFGPVCTALKELIRNHGPK